MANQVGASKWYKMLKLTVPGLKLTGDKTVKSVNGRTGKTARPTGSVKWRKC